MIKSYTLQKSRQLTLRFYSQKAIHFTLLNFPFFYNWHVYIWEKMTLCVMWRFSTQKARHFEKARKFALWFFTQKAWHFALCNFSLDFWNCRRNRDIFIYKNNALCVKSLYQRNNKFSVPLFYIKRPILSVTFVYPKNNALWFPFLYLNFTVSYILITNYKRTYDKSNQIDK